MKTNRYGSFLSHMRRLSGCILILLLCLTLCGMLTEPVTVNAAARPVSITSCKLKGKSRIRVTAAATNTKKIHGSRCYLFALAPGRSSLSSSARPIASARKSKKMKSPIIKKESMLMGFRSITAQIIPRATGSFGARY